MTVCWHVEEGHLPPLEEAEAMLLRLRREGPGRRGRSRSPTAGSDGDVASVVAFTFQVTVDCADPHELADWWAETLGWEVEPQDEAFIRRMVAEGHADESETMLHRGALVWRAGAAIVAPDELGPGSPRVLFQ